MTVKDAAKALILASAIAASIDNIDVLSVQDADGEVIRIEPQSVETVSSTRRKYVFYLTEDEGNADIKGLSLYGNGATTGLGDGTEMCNQEVDIKKTNTQSLLIHWTVRAVV